MAEDDDICGIEGDLLKGLYVANRGQFTGPRTPYVEKMQLRLGPIDLP
jgi:hypothetical protein